MNDHIVLDRTIVKVVWPDPENGWYPAIRIDDQRTQDLDPSRP